MNESNNLNPTPNAIPPVGGTNIMTTPVNNNQTEPVTNPLPPVGNIPVTPPVNNNVMNTPNEPVTNPLPPVGSIPVTPPVNNNVMDTPNEPVTNPLPPIGSIPVTPPVNNNVMNTPNEPVTNSLPPIGSIPVTPNNNIINTQPEPMNNNLNNTPNSVTSSDDDELLKAYIGKNYEKITTKQFNFAAFFLSSLYLFYRKMFLYGFLTFLLVIVISIFVKVPAIGLLVNILLGAFFNKLYVSSAKQKINDIKNKNADKDLDSLKGICAKKGGTSVGLVFLGLLVDTAVMVGIIVVLIVIGFGTMFGSLFSELMNNAEISETTDDSDNIFSNNGNYNGAIMFAGDFQINEYFTLSDMPQKFEDESYDSGYRYTYQGTEGVFNDCKFDLASPSGYTDANTLIEQIAEYNKDNQPTAIETITINGINWYGFSFEDSFGTTYYYGTNKNDRPFLLEYDINIDADSDCATYREQVLNAINAK